MSTGTVRGSATYELQGLRRHPSVKTPARHQEEALAALRRWFGGRAATRGGILVLPTGGGKTFTAARFLTTGPLTAGHKVIWLAHTHHLLDQAFSAFGPGADGRSELGHVGGQRQSVTLRTVSGTRGHQRIAQVRGSDDVVIITLQTLARALDAQVHPGLQAFLRSAGQTGLTIVFDECHHAPAPSFRRLIEQLRTHVPGLTLLGLTATPTYTNDQQQGHLGRLFPQGIRYQANMQDLMLAGILARPIVEEPVTNVQPDFTEHDFRQWSGTYRDLPQKVIAHLAQHRDRNALIATTYAEHREKYGQTIIFADRWYQCEAIVELLRQRGVRADAVYSQQDADPGSPEARNARSVDENEAALARFKRGELDVLVNIRMLTEGTDVPNARTVFLTRQTTSRILLTQMIGRALRGPAFGGTPEAYVVAFIDQWKQHINWARWDDLLDLPTEDAPAASSARLPVEWVSAELIAHLARELDARDLVAVPFLTLLPVGWYVVSYDAAVQAVEQSAADEPDTDDVETVRQLIPVYSTDVRGYERLFAELATLPLDDFGDIGLSAGAQTSLRGWVGAHFPAGDRLTDLRQDVEAVVRHRARNGSWPTFTPFEAREGHDMEALVNEFVFSQGLSRVAESSALQQEFRREDRLWGTLYRNYDQFKRQYDASANRLLYLHDHPEVEPPVNTAVVPEVELEVPSALKAKIRRRDKVCLCCGDTAALQVDHILARYVGGTNDEDNLQLLCGACNNLKGVQAIDFRSARTPLTEAEQVSAMADLLFRRTGQRTSGKMDVLLRRMTNMAYQSAAVASVTYRPGTPVTSIRLKPGHDPQWVQPILDEMMRLWIRDNPRFATEVTAKIRAIAAR
ncbi:DEAD/DEAH box helicase family protein [Deinococcus daejeonensis]|uniref:Type III restriction protein res subunit n=1 Tax=Deinococcus daejeonensis TaxID=1007098 RepID=A0ABQ2JEH8_9DEIO|nr:DEAD/DEAH box helicase family protein [Deinococcus daejeonensis]GGN43310.1 hypothetical protein GCM10010842_30640 [Deinococcus daejeonensis]